jgi:exoribonuclease R
VDIDSLQDMINTLKNLPPIISPNTTANGTSDNKKNLGHRKQHSMSALVGSGIGGGGGGNQHHQVTSNKRLSYNNGVSDMQSNINSSENRQRSRRSSSISNSNDVRDGNIFNNLSRDEALAEAEAKLMGTFQKNRKNMGRRYSESQQQQQQFDSSKIGTSASSGLLSKRTSLQLPTLNENMATTGSTGRRITFNKPLDLSSSNANKFENTFGDTLVENKRLSGGGHQRRSSRNLDMDWRASSNSNINTPSNNNHSNHSSFHLVPFTPTRVNFARDDANPHQRRPLFIAHLPFSALPPLFRSRQLSRGALRVNKRNRSDAYVYCEDLDDDIYICGSRDRNRALEGDVVAVRLVDVDKVLREKKEKEEAKLARNGGQAKVRLPDEEDENEIIFGGDEDVNIVKPKFCGVVVAILERAQNQVFSGTLTLMRPNNKRAQEEKAAEEAKKSIQGQDAATTLNQKEAPRIVWFKSTDKRVPLIAIPIEQAPNDFVTNSEAYSTRLFVGSMKRWPITSLHPFGTLERELGSVYELSTQTKAIFADNNVTDCDFSEAVTSCLPNLPFNLVSDESRRDLREDTLCFTIDPKGSNGKYFVNLNIATTN